MSTPTVGWRALPAATRLYHRELWGSGAALLVLLAAAIVAERRIARPIRRLSASVVAAAGRGPGAVAQISAPAEVVVPRDAVGSLVAAAAHELEATSRLAAIVESSADGMIGANLDGVVTSWNSGAERLFGYQAAEVLGRDVSDLVPFWREAELPALRDRLARGERVEPFETERFRKDGTLVDVSVSLSPLRDRAGAIVGVSVVAVDLTARKQAEADVRALQERVHQAQRMESVGQLAGGIAHDFNNLLAAIMNYAALASDGLDELTAGHGLQSDDVALTVAQDVAEIASVAARAAQLTHQLLIFSRREVVRPEILSLNDVVAGLENMLRQTLGASIELGTDLEPDLPTSMLDRAQVEQVILNLADNASHAMTSGGRLTIATATFEADRDYAQQPGTSPGWYVCLSVSDTGGGMPRDVAARAFEPFFTTRPRGLGSGLGLATVYGIATQAGGSAAIYSEPGLGTTVRVNFPVGPDDAPTVADPGPAKPLTSAGETVLLVEDEDMIREPTRRILVRSGYSVLATNNADDALRVATEYTGQINLLLTDVVMPGRSGKELAAALLLQRPDTKVLFMSGHSQDVIVHRGVLDKGVKLIEKPFGAKSLLRRMRDILDD